MNTELIRQSGLNIVDWNQPIYRVLSIQRFKEMIATKTIALVRPSKWDDPFENFFLKCKVNIGGGQIGSLRQIQEKWYGQCWTTNSDSDAMWRIYSPCKDGVRISTTIGRLFSAIYDTNDKFAQLKYFIGVVEYKTRKEIEEFIRRTSFMDLALGGQADKFALTLCVKRPEFSHEKEVRLLINDVEAENHGDVLSIAFDYEKLLVDVALDPRLEGPRFEGLRSELISLGCSLPIAQSDLYKIDDMMIALE